MEPHTLFMLEEIWVTANPEAGCEISKYTNHDKWRTFLTALSQQTAESESADQHLLHKAWWKGSFCIYFNETPIFCSCSQFKHEMWWIWWKWGIFVNKYNQIWMLWNGNKFKWKLKGENQQNKHKYSLFFTVLSSITWLFLYQARRNWNTQSRIKNKTCKMTHFLMVKYDPLFTREKQVFVSLLETDLFLFFRVHLLLLLFVFYAISSLPPSVSQ